VSFVDGPSPDLRTLDAGEFRFDFPADWQANLVAPVGGGAPTIALLGTESMDACRASDGVDMACVSEQPLAPGAIRVAIATESIRGGTVLDRQDVENGTTTRPSIGSMPAILDVFDYALDSFYREDVSRRWSIALPGSLGRAVTIDLLAREWPTAGTGTTDADVDAISKVMVDSFRFTPPPTPLPSDPATAVAAGRAALQSAAASFRAGYVPAGDSQSIYFDCLAPEPEVVSDAEVRFGPGGDLGGLVHLDCYWSITAESSAIWRVDATYRWAVGDEGGAYIESRWLDARGTEIGSTFRGEPPPAVGPVATESAPPSAGPTEPPGSPIPSDGVLGLPVITVSDAIAVRDSGADGREIAVRGWYSDAPAVPCPNLLGQLVIYQLDATCPEQFMWLMQDPESLRVVNGDIDTTAPPTGPALNPEMEGLDRSWIPARIGVAPAPPVDVVMVGHFDDRRASLCRGVEQRCRDRFVVDRVWSADGRVLRTSETIEKGDDAGATTPAVASEVEALAPDAQILSILTVPLDRVDWWEPSLRDHPGTLMDAAPSRLSMVRVLVGDHPATYLVDGGAGRVWTMADEPSSPIQVTGPGVSVPSTQP
jgi:hypothetical protein